MERPIILKAHEVRGILDGRQTQLRRIMKVQPPEYVKYSVAPQEERGEPKKHPRPYFDAYNHGPFWCWWDEYNRQGEGWIKCPFGKVGGRLWCKEAWWHDEFGGDLANEYGFIADGNYPCHGEDGGSVKHRSSVHMTREYSRILLEIVSVRVERLQDISEADARAMGYPLTWDDKHYDPPSPELDSWQGYGYASHCLKWCKQFGKEGWDANPWVWVVEFKRVTVDE